MCVGGGKHNCEGRVWGASVCLNCHWLLFVPLSIVIGPLCFPGIVIGSVGWGRGLADGSLVVVETIARSTGGMCTGEDDTK